MSHPTIKAPLAPSATAAWLLSGALGGLGLALLDLIAVLPLCASALEAAGVLLVAAAVLAPAGAVLGAGLGLLARGLRPAPPQRGGGLALLLGLGLFYIDTRAYRRLYPGAHGLLLLCEGALLVLATWARVGASVAGRGGAGRRWAAALGLLGLGAGGWLALRHPGVRVLAYQETTAARQPLSLLARLGPSPSPARAPARPEPRPALQAAPRPASSPGAPLLRGAHLVLVTVDALRADRLGARRGGRPLMPNLEALAQGAARFDRAYAAAPHTAFSLASLLTGSPVRALSDLRAPLPRTVAEHLEAAGYRAEALLPDGIFFNGRRALAPYVGSHFGFSRHRGHDGSAASATAAATAVIEEIKDQGEPPSLLWVHYFDPHEPYERRPGHDLGASAEARYDGEVAAVDSALGDLRIALAGLLRPVVLVVTADHGEEFNDHGGYYHGSSLYDEQVRVPLVISAPGLGPRRIEQAVSLVDVVPTLLPLLGAPPLPGGTGRDLGPLLSGAGAEIGAAPVVAEVDTKRMVVKGGWKLIHDQLRDTWELYDLRRDPRERGSVYAREPAVAADLSADLYEWLDRVHRQASEPVPIARGRLGDRRAIPEMGALLRDATVPAAQRAEAARLLGELEGGAEREALSAALADPEEAVRLEAALSLAQLFDARAVPTLEEGLALPAYRNRAGIALGRLRRASAEPALLDALESALPLERRQAAVYLGRVGGAGAIAPLLRRRGDLHAERDAALALGRIGARLGPAGRERVLPALLDWLRQEQREDTVSELCRALAALGDRRAIPALLGALQARPGLSWAAEALVRLGALDGAQPKEAAGLGQSLGGLDLGPGPDLPSQAPGFAACEGHGEPRSDEELGGGVCRLRRREAELRFSLRRPAPGYVLLLRLQPGALDLGESALALRLNGRPLPPQRMQPGWQELQVPVPGALLRRGDNVLALRLEARGRPPAGPWLTVDRLLVVPRQAPGPAGSP